MSRRILFVIVLLFSLSSMPSFAQRRNYKIYHNPTSLIDSPTANFLDSAYVQFGLRMYAQGGILGSVSVQFKKKMMFGISYGGQNVVGYGELQWNEAPGVHIQVQFLEETYPSIPALAIGFNSQGYGAYFREDSLKRYQIKPKGLYLVASWNYSGFLAAAGFHLGANYNNQTNDDDRDLNFFCGADVEFLNDFVFLGEYDFAFNDNKKGTGGAVTSGYLNLGIRFFISDRFILEFALKNLLDHQTEKLKDVVGVHKESREIKLIYFANF